MSSASNVWTPAGLPPERFVIVEVRLANDVVKTGLWTGSQWWCDGLEIRPSGWRPRRKSEAANAEPSAAAAPA